MADDVTLNPGSGGDVVAADDISGVKFQRIKLVLGANGVNDGDVSSANPVPISGSVTGTVTANSTSIEYKTMIDEASSTVTYIGKAAAGGSLSSAIWQIKRLSVSGNVTTIDHADGNTNYDNIWDNRASLSYS